MALPETYGPKKREGDPRGGKKKAGRGQKNKFYKPERKDFRVPSPRGERCVRLSEKRKIQIEDPPLAREKKGGERSSSPSKGGRHSWPEKKK